MALDKIKEGILADDSVTTDKVKNASSTSGVTIPKLKEDNIIQSAIKRSFHKAWVLGG